MSRIRTPTRCGGARERVLLVSTMLATTACYGDDPTDPARLPECTTVTSFAVGAGINPEFSWTPACRVGLLFVEDTVLGLDHWYIQSDSLRIAPPVKYGVVPRSAQQMVAPAALQRGIGYRLVIARVKGQNAAIRVFTP